MCHMRSAQAVAPAGQARYRISRAARALRKLIAAFRLLRELARELGECVAKRVERNGESGPFSDRGLQPFSGNVAHA